MNILALSGSLRKLSYNSIALSALKTLAPTHINILIGNIGELPLFNPDLEELNIPALDELKSSLRNCSGLIIASPEYAHGISGSLKNGLDWLVSGSEFPDMPIMLINTSPRATIAQQALKEVLTTMSGKIIEKANVSIPLLGSDYGVKDILNDQDISSLLRLSLDRFYVEIKNLNSKKIIVCNNKHPT